MPTDFLANAKPVKAQDADFLANAKPVQATVSAASEPLYVKETRQDAAMPWGEQLERDIREGGNRTLPARILGYLQGRGSWGYSGIESGVSKGAADFVGSPELGTAQAIKGWGEVLHHPMSGFGNIAEGALKASQIPLALMGGPEAKGAIDAIPSRAHAISVLNDIEKEAANVPVYMERTQPALDAFEQHVAAGGQDAPVMGKLGERIENVPPRPPKVVPPIDDAPRLLSAGMEEVPLHRSASVPGTPSRPIKIFQPDRPMRLGLPAPSHSIPMSSYGDIFPDQLPSAFSSVRVPVEERVASGMGSGEYIGQIPGERGGEGQVQGVLRRPRAFADVPSSTVEPPSYSPSVNFPEARRFYTNVSDVTKRPGVFKRMMEDSSVPRLRAKAGPVREALHSDIRNAADTIGRGKAYQSAIDEYARNAKMRSLGKKALFAALPTAAASVGAGKLHRFLSSVLQ